MSALRLRRRGLRQLATAVDGVTIIEFGLIAPVLMLMLVGLLDFGYMAYANSVVQGAVQKAARDAALQTNNSVAAANALDGKVRTQIHSLGDNMPQPVITRRYFRNYDQASARLHEPFVDTNGNGRCDNNEDYTDTNWNLVFDADGGNSGGGGAQDRAVYTVTLSFARFLPLDQFINVPHNVVLSATTVLANQPYAEQAVYPPNPVSRKCT